MSKILYSEVSPMFPEIWTNNHGKYWYRKAWETLNNNGYTSYNNPKEEFQVYIRAATLGMLYLDFFYKCYEEGHDYDDIIYAFEKIIKEKFTFEKIKEILCEHEKILNNHLQENEDFDFDLEDFEEYNFNDIESLSEIDFDFVNKFLIPLTDTTRKEILEVLDKNFTPTTTCVAIYCTSLSDFDNFETDDEEDDDYYKDEDEIYIKSLLITNTYETFWDCLNKNFDEIFDNIVIDGNLHGCLEWWQGGAETLQG